jgi:hypothetical protein
MWDSAMARSLGEDVGVQNGGRNIKPPPAAAQIMSLFVE